MSDTTEIWLEIVKTVGTVATALIAAYFTFKLGQAKKAVRKEVVAVKEEVVNHVVELKKEINGRMTELLERTADSSLAKGKEAGKKEQKAEDKKK